MTDAGPQTQIEKPEVINDGWASRNFALCGFALVAGLGIGAAALFVGKCTASEFFGFAQLYTPVVLGIFAGKTIAEKRIGQ